MRKVFFSSLLCGLCATAAFAQTDSSTDAYNGKWNVTIQRSGDKPHTAKLVLTGYSGTWYNVTTADRTKAKVCDGKKFPVTVQESNVAQLEFTAWGSSVSPECPDISVTVRPANGNVLEGILATGESIKLLRP